MSINLTAVYRQFPEGYSAFVEELPGANTQGATLEEARANLAEAVALVLEANSGPGGNRRLSRWWLDRSGKAAAESWPPQSMETRRAMGCPDPRTA